MDKTTTPAASAAKTAQDTIREALDQGSLCSNVAYNLGQHREDSEQILGTVRKFDELRRAALASLKSLDGQEAELSRLRAERDEVLGALVDEYERLESKCNEDDARGRDSHWVRYYRDFQRFLIKQISKHSKEGQEVADNKG